MTQVRSGSLTAATLTGLSARRGRRPRVARKLATLGFGTESRWDSPETCIQEMWVILFICVHLRHLRCISAFRVFREGMWFVSGGPETLRQQLQDGRKIGHHKDLLAANQQVDCGRCSRNTLGVTLRFRE